MLGTKQYMRALSLFVLFTFVTWLAAPIVEASTVTPVTATGTSSAVNTAVNASTTGLSNLWFFWTEHLKSLKVTPDKTTAYSFFTSRGASEQQAMALTANAEASGHLTSTIANSASAGTNVIKSFWNKITAPFRGSQPAQTQVGSAFSTSSDGVQATITKTPLEKVKGFFSRFGKGSDASAAAGSANVDSSSALGSQAAEKTGIFSKIGSGIKKGADAAWLGARRAGSTVGGAAKTGYLTLGDKLDFNRYYEIPLTDTGAIKVRGEFKGVTKFTENGWVVEKYVGTSKTPGSPTDAIGSLEVQAAKPAPTGFFGKIFSKFTDSVKNIKNKMTGKGYTTPETQAELQKLQIEGNLLEQARTLNEAQRAIKYRIDHLKGSAESLRKPVPEEQIQALQKQYDAIEKTKMDLQKKVSGVQSSPARTVLKDAIKWGLFSIGITASVNIIKQIATGEKLDVKKALSFLGEPQFWGGTAGGFLGATLARSLLSSILPPGAGIFLQVLPGFLGAALGFELGSGLFGGQMDLLGAVVQTLASAGGYALAATMLGGGWIAIVASIAAGAIASMILNKIRGGFQSQSYVLPEQTNVTGTDPAATVPPATTTAASATAAAPSGTNLADAQARVKDAYNKYIDFLKQRKLVEARAAHEEYMSAKKVLDGVKAGAQ